MVWWEPVLLGFSLGLLTGVVFEAYNRWGMLRRENRSASISVWSKTVGPGHLEPFCGINAVHNHYSIDIGFMGDDDYYALYLLYCPLTGKIKALNLYPRDKLSLDPHYEEKANNWGE